MGNRTHKGNYGIDAPGVIRNLVVIGICLLILGYFLLKLPNAIITVFALIALLTAVICLTEAVLMILYVKVGKFHHRDRMLAMINWKGDEDVLDVGTGRGLLLIGAAKQLKTGKSFGIDIWNASDMANNSYENALKNAQMEEVAEKVSIKNEDTRKMSFKDNFFDVILSNLCLHNISDKKGREKACLEIIRVLKPGGTAIISDFIHTKAYEEIFKQQGLQTTRTSFYLDTFPPLRIIKAVKPK